MSGDRSSTDTCAGQTQPIRPLLIDRNKPLDPIRQTISPQINRLNPNRSIHLMPLPPLLTERIGTRVSTRLLPRSPQTRLSNPNRPHTHFIETIPNRRALDQHHPPVHSASNQRSPTSIVGHSSPSASSASPPQERGFAQLLCGLQSAGVARRLLRVDGHKRRAANASFPVRSSQTHDERSVLARRPSFAASPLFHHQQHLFGTQAPDGGGRPERRFACGVGGLPPWMARGAKANKGQP